MVAIGARYGHQQISEIGRLTVEELGQFNGALNKLIEAENRSGQGQTGRLATGGG